MKKTKQNRRKEKGREEMYQRVIICPFVMCLNVLGTTFCKDTGSVEAAVETLCHPLFVIYLNECEKKERNMREGEGGGGRMRGMRERGREREESTANLHDNRPRKERDNHDNRTRRIDYMST